MANTAATMNFFRSQEQARQKTALLFLYLLVAYVFIIGFFNLAASAAYWLFLYRESLPESRPPFHFIDPELFPWVSAVMLTLLLAATITNLVKLWRGGGKAVIEMFQARPIPGNSADPDERKLLNVVAEMSIASGMPAPEVYLLPEEESINAFAVGLAPEHAAIVVTGGCLRGLNRDELQGVVAHEFSHILNGDMRLNLRLMATVNGLMFVTLLGLWIMSNTDDSLAVIAAGGVVAAIGSIGVLCSSLIKSAVSRQREFLADASAVQFTRNPTGIAGALTKIMEAGSRIHNFRAGEVSHLFFASGVRQAFLSCLATHPPLAERIRRIDPASSVAAGEEAAGDLQAAFQYGETPVAALAGPARDPGRAKVSAGKLLGSIGAPKAEHVRYAARMNSEIPAPLREAAATPATACALIYALLLDADATVAARQLELLADRGEPGAGDLTRDLLAARAAMKPEQRLPLVDLAMPALKGLTPEQYQRFRECVAGLAAADGALTLFEFLLTSIVKRRLDPLFSQEKAKTKRASSAAADAQGRVLLSALAWEGADEQKGAEQAYQSGLTAYGADLGDLLPRAECGMAQLEQSLVGLATAPLATQARLIKASLFTISADQRITATEAELMRAVSEALGCPMPPILPGLLQEEP